MYSSHYPTRTASTNMAWVITYETHTLIYILLHPAILVLLCILLIPIFIFKLVLIPVYNKCGFSSTDDHNVRLQGKVVLITGASSGIGEELANEYAKRGACLAIVGRREKQLLKVAETARAFGSPDVLPISADVSNFNHCKRFVQQTLNYFGRLDYLVNNAGIASIGSIQDMTDITMAEVVMDVNFWGSIYPTYFAIPHLKKTRGKIIVNSSVSAIFNPPGASFYNASKAALLSFYDTIGAELAPEISITIAILGFVDSEMTRGKILSEPGTLQLDSKFANIVNQFPIMSSRDCAKAIVDAGCRKERYVIEPKWYKAFIMVKYLWPQLVEWFCNRFLVVSLSHNNSSGSDHITIN